MGRELDGFVFCFVLSFWEEVKKKGETELTVAIQGLEAKWKPT